MSAKVAVVIPTFNEKENISNLIAVIFPLLKDVAIIIVDDHSPDGTSLAVEKIIPKYPNLHLITRQGKGGRGSAVLAGFQLACDLNCQIFVEMDADFSHDPQELPGLINLIESDKVILASRYLAQSKIYNWPQKRILSSKLANFLIRIVLNLPTRDNTNGYRCYPRAAVDLLLKFHFISSGYILLSESERYLYKRGFKLVETPSVFRNRKLGKSKATFKEFFYSLYLLLRIRLDTHVQ